MSEEHQRPQEIIAGVAHPLHNLGRVSEVAHAWRADEPGRGAKEMGWTGLSRVPSR
jgi:hypothetical protein